MAAVQQTYRYARASTLEAAGGLALATSPGRVLHGDDLAPRFFSGFVTRPAPFADGLRMLAKVAATRYTSLFDPDRRPRDPVVTSNGDRLRFEAFSACASVYARLDVLEGALDGDLLDRGTTNVDVNEPLRRLLSGVPADEALHLAVGADELAVTTPTGHAVERKVDLPTRWLRGFSEVHVVAATFEPRFEVSAASAARFLRSLPKGRNPGGVVVPAGDGLRLSARRSAQAVTLTDTPRLEALTPLLRHATSLTAFGPDAAPGVDETSSAWQLDMGSVRMTVALSPHAARGWSGEGAALMSLVDEVPESDVDLVAETLEFDARLDVDDLADRSGLDRPLVRRVVDVLGTSGRVGYDLAEAGWFHRELPFAPEAVAALNPRLRAARDLVADSAVTVHGDGTFSVRSRDRVYRARVTSNGRWSCTCQWWIEHRGGRGPCKHVLAAARTSRRETERVSTVAVDNDRSAHR